MNKVYNNCLQLALKKMFSSLQLNVKNAELVQCCYSWSCKDKSFSDNQIYYVIDGEFRLIANGIDQIIRQGQMILIPAGMPVTCEMTSENNKLFKYWLRFTSNINSVNLFNLINTEYIITVDDPKSAEDLFYNMIFKNKRISPEARLIHDNAYLMMILALFIDNAAKGSITFTHSEVDFEKIIKYMYKNMNSDISLSDMASLVHLSNDYFSQLFKKFFLVSPIRFLNEMRIECAKVLLENNNNMTTAEAACLVGFNDISYFNKTYKDIYGHPPKNIRFY